MKIFLYEMSGKGGFGNYCRNLSNALGKILGKESVFINTVKADSMSKNRYINATVIDNLKSFSSSISKKNKLVWLINRVYVTTFNAILRLINIVKYKPDIVNINQIIPVIDQFFISMIKKKSVLVITVHDVIPPIKSPYWTKRSLKRVYDIADYLIVHSKENKELLIKQFGINKEKIEVIEHGVEADNTEISKKECRQLLKLPYNKFVVLFFGTIRESKGLDLLIEAMEGLDESILLIAGSMPFGENFVKYSNLLKKYNVESVTHIEYIEDSMVPVYFKAADLVVLPYKEFFSQSGVLMQAVTYKKPVVVTDVSAFRAFIEKYNVGEIVPPKNVVKLKEAIKKLYLHRDVLERYERNMVKAYQDLNWDEVCKRHVEFYKKIIL